MANYSRGFSIIELVLVLAMLGVVGVSAIVKGFSPDAARLDAAANQISSDIMLARENALATGHVSGVQFINGENYVVYQGTVLTPLASPLTKQNMIVLISTNYPTVSLTKNFIVEFDKSGAPSIGGGGDVTISNGKQTKTIIVTAHTGRISIQ